ncbi:MAG: hypothetical protein FOGNACKC_02229 [Anaerolineae bacterium]|nr:hypothetical protein [Anaerolineae bacterium]
MAFQLGSAYGEIRIAGGGALSTISQVRRGLLGLGGPMGAAGVAALGLGAGLAAVAGAGAGLAAIIGRSVSVAADLEAQLDGVQAVTGATSAEMAGLKELITNLGVDPNLKVSALEAAAAVEMLGRNGMPVADIMNGAARSTVLLANATGGDFAQSADIATDVMALFKIRAEDMEQAVDGITSVVNNSKFDMNDYQLAIAQGGGAAAAFGVEFEDFNTAIAATSAAFASGSDAGTSFKVFLQRLVPQSKEAVEVMRELGLYTGLSAKEYKKSEEKLAKLDQQIANLNPNADDYAAKLTQMLQQHTLLEQSLKQGQNAFYDENGNLKDMASIFGLLQQATAGLSEEQKNNALSTIFGADAMRIAARIAEVGESNFRNLQATMGQTSAAEAAATRMDNLRGAMEILDGIVETLKIRIGDEFIPVLTDNVRGLSSFLEAHQDSIVGFFGGIADSMGAMADTAGPAIDNVLSRVEELMLAYQAGGLFGQRSGSFGSEGLLSALGVSPEMQDTLQGIIADINGFIDQINAAVTGFQNVGVQGEGGVLDNLFGVNSFEGLFAQIVTQIPGLLSQVITGITSFLQTQGPVIGATVSQWATDFWSWINTVLATAGQSLAAIIATIGVWASNPDTQAQLLALGNQLGRMLVDGLKILAEQPEQYLGVMLKIVGGLGLAALAIAGLVIEIGANLVAGLVAGIISAITGTEWKVMTLDEWLKSIQWMKDVIMAIDWLDVGANMIQGMIDGMKSKYGELFTALGEMVGLLPGAAEEELEIKSPSRLFAGIGKNISLGLAQGIAGAALAPAHEIAAMTTSLPAYAMPAGGGAVSQNIDNRRVTENKFTMSIGTVTNGESGVIQGYNTLRALAA